MHLTPAETEAKKTAGAVASALSRWIGSGSFEMRGNPFDVAGAPVTLIGFGAAIESIKWVSTVVTHTIDPEGGGWITMVEVETKE